MIDSNPPKKVHIPFCDVDDLAFKNRHDPNFVASITNLMQVPSTITLTNGKQHNMTNNNKLETPIALNSYGSYYKENLYGMDVPDKLTVLAETTEAIESNLNKETLSLSNNDEYDEAINDLNGLDLPRNISTDDFIEEQALKTPQLASELFKRQRHRRSSLEVDLHAEIRLLRDKINRLEHECQQNTNSSRLFYACICGYFIVKTFSWLLNSR